MALKGYLNYGCGSGSDVKWVMNTAAEAGIIVTIDTTAGGSGLPGDSRNVVRIPPSGGGQKAVGVLMTEVVDIDVTQYPLVAKNHKSVTTVCNPVNILDSGEIQTNKLTPSLSVNPGDKAYFTTGGLFTNVAGYGPVGEFQGEVQADGYVVIKINIER